MEIKGKDVLSFRPRIDFVEPDQEPAAPNPKEVSLEEPTLQDVSLRRQKIKALAHTVAILAELVQVQVDEKASSVVIDLDPNVDAAVIQAMARLYPGADSNKITYDQFRQCEESFRKYGEKYSEDIAVSGTEVLDARRAMANGDFSGLTKMLRPELDKKNQIIEPVNVGQFQSDMIALLVNLIWKNAMLPLLKDIPVIGSTLPEELIKPSRSSQKMQENMEDQGVAVAK